MNWTCNGRPVFSQVIDSLFKIFKQWSDGSRVCSVRALCESSDSEGSAFAANTISETTSLYFLIYFEYLVGPRVDNNGCRRSLTFPLALEITSTKIVLFLGKCTLQIMREFWIRMYRRSLWMPFPVFLIIVKNGPAAHFWTPNPILPCSS